MRRTAFLLRFDTEDFLTAESDGAALFLAQALRKRGIRATFPVTAMKAEALARRRPQAIRALRWHSVGFHSTSHSVHPTLAEQLLEEEDADAAAAFERREEAGFRATQRIFEKPLDCYTQPGGNWLAEAAPALVKWGVPLHYGEGWNAYVDMQGRPFFYQGLLHWSAAVSLPKPFLSGLPSNLEVALQGARRAAEDHPSGLSLVNLVTHPTELVTRAFWDAVNFSGGQNRPRKLWRPAPLRPRQEVALAKQAFETFLDGLLAVPGAEFWTGADLVAAFPDRARTLGFTFEDALSVARVLEGGRAGTLGLRGATLSPAEAVTLVALALAALEDGCPRASLSLPRVAAHFGQEAGRRQASAPAPKLLRAARQLGAGGAFPTEVAGLPAADGAGALARLLLERVAAGGWPAEVSVPRGVLLTLRWVRPAEELHWDWPIFPPGFRAGRLLRRARRAAWTLKPAEVGGCDEQVP